MNRESRVIPARLAYQPALDGLRALAVLAVMTFHQGHLTGGFLGVDVFFVLSGFLITSLLLIDHAQSGRVVSLRFWARRARRLFPAILVLLCIVAIYAVVVANRDELPAIRSGSLATLLYVQNYWFVAHPTYGHYPLGHTWSLSIEEQFYVVWPLLLALVVRYARRPAYLVATIGVLAIGSALLMAASFGSGHGTMTDAYFPTQTRAQELLVGAGLAVVLLGWRGPTRRAWSVTLEVGGALGLGALVLLSTSTNAGSAWLYRGGFFAIAIISALLISAAVAPTSTRLRWVLSWRPLVAIGLISYGLYLYHVPMYGFVNYLGIHNEALRVSLGFAAVFVVAIASYFLIERPIRRGGLSTARVRVVAPVAVAVVVGLLFVSTLGGVHATAETRAADAYDAMAATTPPGSVRVLVAGDSLAGVLGLRSKTPYLGSGIQGAVVSVYGCDAIEGAVAVGRAVFPAGNCSKLRTTFESAVSHFEPAVVVLMLGPSTVFDRIVNGQRLQLGTAAFEAYFDARLGALQSILTGSGARIVLATAPCMNPPSGDKLAGLSAVERDPARVTWADNAIRRYAMAHEIPVADYQAFLCPNDAVRARSYRSTDGVGLTVAGASATWEWIAPIAARAAH